VGSAAGFVVSLVAKDYATRQSVDTQQALIAQLEATICGDQAAIENAQTQLSYTSIVSPLDGRTGMRLIDRGNIGRLPADGRRRFC
jgi:membrane fusion protein, multidrug efflux system